MARGLLHRGAMTTFARLSLVLLALCSSALADPAPPPAPTPPRPELLKIRFSLRDVGAQRDFQVTVSPDNPCATAFQKSQDREVELKACASRDAHVAIDWRVTSAAGEYHSTSSIPSERGTSIELGSSPGPRLAIALQ